MCVYYDMNNRAIVKSEKLIYMVAVRGFLQNNGLQSYINLRKRQEQVENFLFVIQENVQPQLQYVKNDKYFIAFFSYHEEELGKLQKIEEKYIDPFSEEKKNEMLEEKGKMLKNVISHSLLRQIFYDDAFRQLKPGPEGQPESMEIYFNILNAGLKYWQTLKKQD